MESNQSMRRLISPALKIAQGLASCKAPGVRLGSLCGLGLGLALTVQVAQAQTAPAPTAAESAIAGRVLASNCANCHGMDGRSAGGMPMLAGYPRDALVATMQAFRSGQRPATIMHQLAKGYTDDQIALVAEHFSRLKATP